MKKAYGYCRASTGKQSLTFEAQRSQIEKYYESKLQDQGYEWGGFFEDKATSGGKPFTEREEGVKLWVVLQPGDAVIWAKMDRAFRSVRDGANTMHLLDKKQVSVHSIDINLDTTTALGKFVCHLLMLLGELERSWVSSRTKEALDAKRRAGMAVGKTPPAGWRIYDKRPNRVLDEDKQERNLIDAAYRAFVNGTSIETIAHKIACRKARRRSGHHYHVKFLLYALHARALGYPAQYTSAIHREMVKKLGGGRGRAGVISRLQQLEESREHHLQHL